jgi:hypothetical protein
MPDPKLSRVETEHTFWFWVFIIAAALLVFNLVVIGAVLPPPPIPVLRPSVVEVDMGDPRERAEQVYQAVRARAEGDHTVLAAADSFSATRIFVVTFDSLTGRQYRLQRTGDGAAWLDVSERVAGTGGPLALADWMDQTAALYRVKIQ